MSYGHTERHGNVFRENEVFIVIQEGGGNSNICAAVCSHQEIDSSKCVVDSRNSKYEVCTDIGWNIVRYTSIKWI